MVGYWPVWVGRRGPNSMVVTMHFGPRPITGLI
jgi:hypothetical protein